MRYIPIVKLSFITLLLAAHSFAADAPLPAKVEYNRDVRPILADNCFTCHGFDPKSREADLRLDVREAAVAKLDGAFPILPGKPDESEVWKRITTKDEDDVMPPKKQNRQLSARDKKILRKWIEQGAEYQQHWAYIPAEKPAPPAASEPAFARNAIDTFVLARHASLGIKHATEADRATLCRRVYLDVTGLPPKPEELDSFVNDKAPDAYEKLVEKLLASPHYGERMAVWWLDLVRYADTTGYHSDNPRNVSPYRDYVIRSFNANKRFDRFTIEQIAGDLLPDVSNETRVASAYNRLILTTEEGGAQAKEYEAKAVTDRVKSIGTTWLAQTYMCCECHDHKFDPVTTRDFYALGAFFTDIKENAIGAREAGARIPTPEQEVKLKEFDSKITALQEKLVTSSPELDAAQVAWEKTVADSMKDFTWTALKPGGIAGASKFTQNNDASISVAVAENPEADSYKLTVPMKKGTTGVKLEVLADPSLPASGPGRAANGSFVLNEIALEREGQPMRLSATATFEQPGFLAKSAVDGKLNDPKNGWGILGNTGKDTALYLDFGGALPADEDITIALHQTNGTNHTIGQFRLFSTDEKRSVMLPKSAEPADIVAIIKTPARTPEQKQKLASHYRTIAPIMEAVKKEIAAAQKERAAFEKTFAQCLITESGANRTVRVLPRGDWQNDKGDIMQPATPHYLPGATSQPAEGKRLTRLDLAQWLVKRENPLTARVFANRLWKQFYGTGLSKTLEDMGTQGEVPTMQPLLDWLAVDFMDSGWDIKHLVRTLVTSGTYRQASNAPGADRDPFNRDLARQSRWRLDAEFVRDNALTISGLLVDKIGGPSVKPYQPAGYWENLNFPVREWANDKGPDQWRRGLYTWWQRSYLQPAMLALDAPTREECAADRTRSNIPQQALTLLNNPEYVEAARALAARMIKEGGNTPADRIAWAWKTATARAAKPAEIATLSALYDKHLATFTADASNADALLNIGLAPQGRDGAKSEIAAYTSVARVILNLHETITRM